MDGVIQWKGFICGCMGNSWRVGGGGGGGGEVYS